MAEFRKLFYAFGLAALITGASSTASAQTTTQCTGSAGVPPIIRAESFSDLVGDYILTCTGGTPTAVGQNVPQVNFTLTVSTNITSRLLAGSFTEALLIVDEPNSAANPTTPILACNTGNATPISSDSGICTIVSTGTPAQTYNGNNVTGAARPNVFQGRVSQNPNESNVIQFNGVPFDPPGTGQGVTPYRTFRFTNVRVNAPAVSSTFLLQNIVMRVNVNGSTSVNVTSPEATVASVRTGLLGPTVTRGATFVQCNPVLAVSGNGGSLRYTEGFPSSFKTRNFQQMIFNGTAASGSYRFDTTIVNGATLPGWGTSDIKQNVPGANYNTESGFTHLTSQANANPNPPAGIGTVPVTGTGVAFPAVATGTTDPATTGNNIGNAGIATQGTRLAVTFRDIPAGVTVTVPAIVYLYPAGTIAANQVVANATGVARLVTNTTANGINGGILTPTGLATAGAVAVPASGILFYEVLFADPYIQEDMQVPVTVSSTPNLASNLPEPFKTATATGGFAPFIAATDSAATWSAASSTLPVPRFRNTIANYQALFDYTKCACNLLFPFVTNLNTPVGNFDTGFAIANTSLLPATTFGFNSNPQAGAVQMWYYSANPSFPAVATQTTNKVVPAGETLTYSLYNGSPDYGLDTRARGFQGYMVVQTQFQYCHGFAYISAQGAGPSTPGMSVGYLGLILDKDNTLPNRTNQQGESLNQ